MPAQELRDQIQELYREIIDKKGLSVRHGQKVMIAEVAKTLSSALEIESGKPADGHNSKICVIEAGTGTGKTLAYILSALPVAMKAEKQLVISTATVALQEQLINKDLPDIREHSSLDFQFALVKGRARYVCLLKLLSWEQSEVGFQDELVSPMFFDEKDEESVSGENLKLYQNMIEAFDSGAWDGERDHWPEEVDGNSWRPVMANRQDCTAKKCPNYKECSFFEARKKVNDADCIVTNHDLVMADIVQGEGGILPAPDSAFYIFDEGHHLPIKALSHFSSSFRIKSSQVWLLRAQQYLEDLIENEDLEGIPKIDFEEALHQIESLKQNLEELLPIIEQHFLNNHESKDFLSNSDYQNREYCRFEDGELPKEIRDISKHLELNFARLLYALNDIGETLKDQAEHLGNENIIREISSVVNLQQRSEAAAALFASYARELEERGPNAKWIEQSEYNDHLEFQLSFSPLFASQLLSEIFWSKSLGVIITSATLTALGEFSFFVKRTGLPDSARFFRISSPFNYQEAAKLVLPEMRTKPMDGQDFFIEVSAYIEKWAPFSLGTLVLFSSWRQMNEVTECMDRKIMDSILIQGEISKEEIIKRHKEAVDQGKNSIIFGLASFAEGVDLPGEYLSHVIIARIPFSVPTDPLEESMAEWVSRRGGNPFNDISVPEASLKLIQACGRLLRSETDSGRISILDRRIVEKSYGKQLLNSLPPYSVQYSD